VSRNNKLDNELSEDLKKLVAAAKVHDVPNSLVGTVAAEKFGLDYYDVSIWTKNPGRVDIKFRKVEDDNCRMRKSSGKKSRFDFDFPDASCLCAIEYLESAISTCEETVLRKQRAERVTRQRERNNSKEPML